MKKIVKQNKKYIIILLIVFSIFFVLKLINNFEIFSPLDNYVGNCFKGIYNPSNEIFLSLMSDFLGFYIPIAILVCLLVMFSKKIYFKIQFTSYMFTIAVLTITKNIIQRQRPTMNALATIDTYSFPSGHTLTSFVFYYLLAYILSANESKKTKLACNIIATIIVTTVAMSRLYLNVHYITDILGALIIGSIILKIIKNIVKNKYERKLL